MLQDRRFIALVAVSLVAVAIWNWSFFTTLKATKPAAGVHITVPQESAPLPGGHPTTMRLDHTTFPLQTHTVAVTPVQGPWTDARAHDIPTHDPFRTTAPTSPPGAPPWQPDFQVSAILTGGHRNVAIINDQTVVVGDTIGGLPITEIALGWVVLGTGGSRRVIVVE